MAKHAFLKNPLISIVYIYYDTPNEITSSITSLKKAILKYSFELVIVDNNSRRSLPSPVKKNKRIKIIFNKKNLGYSKAINQASKISTGKYLLIVNPDTIFLPDSISRIIEKFRKNQNIGIIGPQMLDKKGNILQSMNGMPFLPDALFIFSFLNSVFPKNKYSKRYWLSNLDKNETHEVDFVGGACLAVRKEAFDRVVGFDERFFMYFEEVDFCYRVKKLGYRIIYYPKAKIIHLVGKSNKNKQLIRKYFEHSRYLFLEKYHGFFLAFISEMILRLFSRASIKKFIWK